ncbi:hypothetical protein ACO0LB_05535 [Undibacterium sp. SXout7W]|uniref:hypothetical protein n=1 Tax=Undibacterium sp. SXout7W TaxID=3413049 RepID=UPI003BF11F7D
MDLHQIQISYQDYEDRLLVKFSFAEPNNNDAKQEIKVWFTRRLALMFWPAILEALAKQVSLNKPEAAHASADILQMEHEASLSKVKEAGGFNAHYDTKALSWPMGEAPLLPNNIQFHFSTNQPMTIEFALSNGKGFEVGMAQNVVHSFCKLFQDAVEKADWGFMLEMPGTKQESVPAHLLN